MLPCVAAGVALSLAVVVGLVARRSSATAAPIGSTETGAGIGAERGRWWRCRRTRHGWETLPGVLGSPRTQRTPSGSATRASGWILGLLLSAALLAVTAGAEAQAQAGPVAELAAERAAVRVTGRVMSEPRQVRLTEAGPARVVVLVEVTQVEARGVRTNVTTPVLVMGDASWSEVGWREIVETSGRLKPGESGDQVRALLSASAGPTTKAGPGVLVGIADHARDATRRVVEPLPEDARGLVPAMIIGDRSGVPDDLTEAMRATGMSHLTAVSGTNCTLVVAAAMWLCGLCLVPRRVRPVVGGLVLAGFVVLARPDPSVIRAAVMGGIGLIGVLGSRRPLGMPALGGAILVLLTVDPWLSRSYGFALSALATLGLLLFARPWAESLRRVLPIGPVAEALTIPLAAQVMCAPVIVLLQGEISVVGVVANAIVAPLVAPVTVLGALVTLLAVPWPWAATLLAWCAALPAWGIAAVARAAEHAPFRALPWRDDAVGAFTLAALLLVVILGGAAGWRWGRRHRWTVLVAAVLALAILIPLSYVRSRTGFPGADPALVMCDVGQGDALVAMTAPGHALVVDVGPDPDQLDHCLDDLNIETVDAVVLTHFDTDHVGGLSGLGRGRNVGDVVVSAAAMSEVRRPVERWWRENGRPVHVAAQGDRFTWGRVSAIVRNPRRRGSAESPNAGSLVLDLVISGAKPEDSIRALLLADIDEEAGQAVRRDLRAHPEAPVAGSGGALLPFDVIKVAHHGSAHQDGNLIVTLAAAIALISVGEDNSYGHPAPRLLHAVGQAGSAIYRSDRDGSVAVRKEGGTLLVVREHRA